MKALKVCSNFNKFVFFFLLTCAYAPYAPNWLKTNGFNRFIWPAICCIRRNCRSFSVSANFTTKLEDAPCQSKRERKKNDQKRVQNNNLYYNHQNGIENAMENFFYYKNGSVWGLPISAEKDIFFLYITHMGRKTKIKHKTSR